MKFGVADFGMNMWEGGLFDIEQRLIDLKGIGYEGTERLVANSASDALHKAGIYRKLGMDFALCLGFDAQATIQWTAGLGKNYVWVGGSNDSFDLFCRQAQRQAEICRRWNLRGAVHNHLGSQVESQKQVVDFLARCPACGLVLDTAHLAAADGDPVEIVRKYPDRIVSMHLKDWLVTNPEIGLDRWGKRGRFCELGAGNIGMDNIAVMRALVDVGYDGWIFIEHDTHLQEPLKDLAISRQYLKKAGF